MKILILIIVLFTSLTFISCEEDFDPKAEYRPKYILSCIIRGDTTYQTVTISKSYMVNGYDPYENTEDPFLSGADVRLWQKDSVYFFRDSTIERSDTSRYRTPLKFYYIDNFKPAENVPLEIRAITVNGKSLFSSTILPKRVAWDTVSNFQLPVPGSDKFLFQWIPAYSYGWYLMKFSIRYRNIGAGSDILTKEVALRYNGNSPVFPKPTKSLGYEFEMAALDRAMMEISEGDPVKNNYIIYGSVIELLIFDQNLSRYFSSLNGFADDFTVRVDQTDYTNVEGGLGIFGSYLKQLSGAAFTESYVRSFNYRVNN